MLEAELATSATTASVSLREQTLALQSHNATLAAKEHALAEELAQVCACGWVFCQPVN
jgi:hypothetical protein